MRLLLALFCCSISLQAYTIFIPYFGAGAMVGNGLQNNLVAFWTFNEETESDALDSSGNGRTLTQNAPITVANDGLNVNANARDYSSFDDNDYFYRASEAAFTFGSSPFTIAGWFQVQDRDLEINDATLIGKINSDLTEPSWWVQFDRATLNDQVRFFYSTDGADISNVLDFDLGTEISVATWYFYCVRYDGTNIHLSVTSIEDSSVATDVTVAFAGPFFDNSTVPIRIGGLPDGSYDLDGRIDEVGIWSAYLSDCQIGKLFSARIGNFSYPQFDTNACE